MSNKRIFAIGRIDKDSTVLIYAASLSSQSIHRLSPDATRAQDIQELAGLDKLDGLYEPTLFLSTLSEIEIYIAAWKGQK